MTFCGLNTQLFESVPCLGALLSAAEMLQQTSPTISGAFMKYANALIENYLAQTGSTEELDAALAPFTQRANAVQAASARDLERFGDALVAAAEDDTAVDFHKIAYLCYTATSIYGVMTSRVMQKMSKAEQILNSGTAAFALGNIPSPPAGFPGYPSVGGAGGPPVFTPGGGAGGPPVFTPGGAGAGGPPVFTPGGAGGPPVFTPGGAGAGGPPVFTPGGAGGPPVFTPGGAPPSFNAQPQTSQKAVDLTTLAKTAFQAGANEVALTAIMAAINELQRN